MAVVLYSTGCPKCKVLTKKLNIKNVEYTEVNDVEIMKSMGITTVPMLSVDSTLMDYVSAIKWVNEQE